MVWRGIWYGAFNNCGVRLNEVEKNKETDEEHDEDCIDEGFQLARVKFDKDGKGGRDALVMGYCSSNT